MTEDGSAGASTSGKAGKQRASSRAYDAAIDDLFQKAGLAA